MLEFETDRLNQQKFQLSQIENELQPEMFSIPGCNAAPYKGIFPNPNPIQTISSRVDDLMM